MMASTALVSPEGEATIAGRTCAQLPIKFYASWHCPHCQSAWIGLEEKGVEYQWVDIDLYELVDEADSNVGPAMGSSLSCGSVNLRPRKRPLSQEELRNRYPAFVECSPRCRAPALDNCGEMVSDSMVLLEYIHEAFLGPPLLPASPHRRAQVRLWTRHVEQRIVPHFENLLSAQDPDERAQARLALHEGLAEFEAAMAPEADGPFFMGDDFSMTDAALAPWWQRMCSVLRAYRKFDPSVWPRLQVWYEAVQARPSYRGTAVDPERLIEEYSDRAADTSHQLGPEGGAFRRAAAPFRSGARPGGGAVVRTRLIAK